VRARNSTGGHEALLELAALDERPQCLVDVCREHEIGRLVVELDSNAVERSRPAVREVPPQQLLVVRHRPSVEASARVLRVPAALLFVVRPGALWIVVGAN
jgi:hypothetical protein